MNSTNLIKTIGIILFIAMYAISFAQAKKDHKSSNQHHFQFSEFHWNGSSSPEMNKGFWTGVKDGNTICLNMTSSPKVKDFKWQFSVCLPTNEFTSNSSGVSLQREAGTLVLNGKISDWEGMGKFEFIRSNDFMAYLDKQGISDVDDRIMLKMFLGNVTKAYVSELASLGYNPTAKDLGKLASVGTDIDYIKSIREVGYRDMELNMMAKFYIHGVTPEYIKGLSQAGYSSVEPNMVKKFLIHDVTIKYINELNRMGLKNLDPNDIKKFAVHDVSTSFIKSILNLGIEDYRPKDFVKCKIHDIDANDLKKAIKQNDENLSLKDYIRYIKHS